MLHLYRDILNIAATEKSEDGEFFIDWIKLGVGVIIMTVETVDDTSIEAVDDITARSGEKYTALKLAVI